MFAYGSVRIIGAERFALTVLSLYINFVSAIDDTPKLHELDRFERCLMVVKIIDRVAAKWKAVALRLHFDDHLLEVIEADCHHQSVRACRTMFTRWLEGIGRKPTTWRTLVKALKEANLSALAEEVEKMFTNSLSTTITNQTNFSPAGMFTREGLTIIWYHNTCDY